MASEHGDAAAFGRWSRRMVVKAVPGAHKEMHQKIHIQLGDGLIADSAVGNPSLWKSPPPKNYAGGRFKGNWQSSIGRPIQGESGRKDTSGSATKLAGQAVARRIDKFERSFIVNNVPYAVRLNQSPPHTTQMAPGFVQRNLQRVRSQFKPFRGGG